MQIFKMPFDGTEVVRIGYQNDNKYQIVRFDASAWDDADKIEALYMRPDGVAYPVELEAIGGGVYEWRPCAKDALVHGWGKIQIRAKRGAEVWHTPIAKCVCMCSVNCE